MSTYCTSLLLIISGILLCGPTSAQVYLPGNGVVDSDGNFYPTVIYGNGQEWMVENLRTTRYDDGTDMLLIDNDAQWAAQAVPMPQYTPAYCWYGDDIANKELYGALYSWFVIDSISNGGRSACPAGWQVPASTDWTQLIDHLVVHGLTYDGSTTITGAFNKLGKAMADTAHWLMDTVTVGVPANEPELNNAGGFTGRPGGSRGYLDGIFTGLEQYGNWWDRDPLPQPGGSAQVTTYRLLLYGGQANARHLGHYYGNKMTAKSIRCMRANTGTGTRQDHGHAPVMAFPNPFHQYVTIVVDPATVGRAFTLCDAMGRTVLWGTVEADRWSLGTQDLPSGIYLLQVEGPEAWSIRLVKED